MRRQSEQLQAVATSGVEGSVRRTAPQWQEPSCIGLRFRVLASVTRPTGSSNLHVPGRPHSIRSFVRAQQDRLRNGDSLQSRSLEIDDELVPRRLLDGKGSRRRAVQNLSGVDAHMAIHVRKAGSVAHETTGLGEFADCIPW